MNSFTDRVKRAIAPVLSTVVITVVITAVSVGTAVGQHPWHDDLAGAAADGDTAPAGWTLDGPDGRWVDRQVLRVTGNGEDSGFWRNDTFRFAPGRLYHFQARARRIGSSGSAVCGPAFANRDFSGLQSDWKTIDYVCRAPDNLDGSYVRLGHWRVNGAVEFDSVTLTPAVAVHGRSGDFVLGEGESIRDRVYTFAANYNHLGSNHHRPLVRATSGFNSNRWTFGTGSEVVYRFGLPASAMTDAKLVLNVGYHIRGACVAEASLDGEHWIEVARQTGLGTAEGALPAEAANADRLFVRFRADGPGASFQLHAFQFRARLNGNPADAVGRTWYADLTEIAPGAYPERLTLDEQFQNDDTTLDVRVHNKTDAPVRAVMTTLALDAPIDGAPAVQAATAIEPGGRGDLQTLLPSRHSGTQRVAVSIAAGDEAATRLTLTYSVPDYYRADYGQLLPGGSDDVALWYCDATRKVPVKRMLPAEKTTAASICAARNEFEALQIVVRPRASLSGLTASATPLAGPGGATIPASNIDVSRVYYHFVHTPTDATGVRDYWPDALPPLTEPIDVPAGHNQPIWVLVYVPEDAAAGDYRGKLNLSAGDWSAEVPIRLHVWDFALPKANHLETAFGLSLSSIARYHQLRTEADKRRVWEMYLENFANHRISPYDPVPMDPIRVKFVPDADPPRAEVDFTAFDREMQRVVDKYHFTGIRLPIHGMGGGTFHGRSEPRIGQFGESTPEYQAMFGSYVGQLESHLSEKGWLDLAYVYWFDEPAPRDFEFVIGGMRRLDKYAPGLRRMLTEEPVEPLVGSVDIWCPVSHNFSAKEAAPRLASGETFWWYVCTGPKAPYCTLFIDHAATELRVWHWQAWQRGITGSLVWASNYWSSSAAFPDSAQNPYEDPMGYVSGYSTPRGTKRHWGNGDGRFVYPPLSAAIPGLTGPDPVLDRPVSSLRWEMVREGVEDYEYLVLLRQLLAGRRGRLTADEVQTIESLLAVPETITADMTTFATDSTPIYTRRKSVAEAIERLSRLE